MSRKELIKEEIKKQYWKFSEKYEVFGVFLYGSQNYGTDTEKSDIDTKVIIVPDFQNLCFGEPVNKRVKTDTGEADIKDIREVFDLMFLQNINYLEILFTEYNYINPKYKTLYNHIFGIREDIARYHEESAYNTMFGMYFQARIRLTRTTPTTEEDIKLYGYHRKSLSNMDRMCRTIEKYMKGRPYGECIYSPGSLIYKEEALDCETLNITVHRIDELEKKLYEKKGKIPKEKLKAKNEHIKTFTEQTIKRIICKNIKRDIESWM